MPLKTLKEKRHVSIEATGSLGVEQSEELLESLRKALSGDEGRIEIDFSGVTDADISCLQLICSAHKSAAEKGKLLSFIRVSPELKHVAGEAGFTLKSGCATELGESCPWDMISVQE